ncbi:DNA-binding protein, partial [Enterococcus faecium]|nr:DNA-binding protein [Enterococcus faecium]
MNIVEEKFVQETKQADIDHHKPTAGAMVGHVLANFKLEEMKL